MSNEIKTDKNILINIASSSKEFDIISEIVEKTCPNQCIILIQKIENKTLIERFNNYKNKLSESNNIINEVYGFHGTNFYSIENICLEGFNKGYNKRAAYGIGTYLASSFGYSKVYSGKGKYDYKIMLICKIIYNNICLGKNNQNCPEGYDIQVDNIKNPKIYSVNNDESILPLYVIHFYDGK